MNRPLLSTVLLVGSCLYAALTQGAIAADSNSTGDAPAVAKSRTGETPAFAVYKSQGCSRTFQKVADYPCAVSACRAAAEVKGASHVWVATGNLTHAFRLISVKQYPTNIKRYSVYVVGPESGPKWHSTTESFAEAQQAKDRLSESGKTAILVYDLK